MAGVLAEADYRAMLDMVRVVGEVTDPEAFAATVAEQVGHVVASDVTSLNDVDPVAGVVRFVMYPSTFQVPDSASVALAELAERHPLIRYVGETGDGSAHKISDFWTTEVWHRSALYERVYEPMGVEHQMSISLPAPRPAVVGLALNRFELDFSERDRAVLNQIRPHLAQSWRHAREHARLRELVETAADALGADGSAVLLLTEPVHDLTPGALTELYRFFGRPPAASAMPQRVERWLERQRASALAARLGELEQPLRATRDGRRLVVRYLPGADGPGDALLLRVSTPQDTVPQLTALGLSEREVEVLTLMTSGATNNEIAAHLHLAPSTVKHHLDHVYQKLGVSGRVQASAVALSMLAHHGSPPKPR